MPLRSADLHYDIVPLLKEKTVKSCLKFSNLLVDNSTHTVQVDISLVHPYPVAPQLAGFDVRGILFTKGNGYTLSDNELMLTGPDEPRLVNADGYTRWWNPEDFPSQILLGYSDGKYGTPYTVAWYQITLAGYRYFADGLGAVESLDALNENDRGVFRAGETNTRRYLINFGTTAGNYLVFNYAVDACWGPIPGFDPDGPPPNVPADFPLTTNCPEPFRIRIAETSNTLTATTASGTSGNVQMLIDVFDWQALSPVSSVPTEVSVVQVEAPAFGGSPVDAVLIPGSGNDLTYSTYTASLTGSCPEKLDWLDVAVSATSSQGDYQNSTSYFLGHGPLQAFNVYRAKVADADAYSGWTHRYSRSLYPEYPNQGANRPDITVYKSGSQVKAVTMDQANPDPDNEGNHHPDSVNEWTSEYTNHSLPEHYHFNVDELSDTGKWDDINNICISDSGTRLFFTNTNKYDEFATGETDPLYSYLSWMSHTYLGNASAETWQSAFFSAGDYPRYWATDPSNGLAAATDWIYSLFIYDTTGIAGGSPGADPGSYVIFRWAPPYDFSGAATDWQRATNVPPNGDGTGFVDLNKPYDHRLAVDDTGSLTRVYILDSVNEIEVVDCDFAADEFSGSFPRGTVTLMNKPAGVTTIMDIEAVQTKSLGAPRNYVAALCQTGITNEWRIWVFDFVDTNAIPNQGVTQWLSDAFTGEPYAIDAIDNPIELHVLYKSGGMVYVSVFRDYP
jgi:hypothetical protein